MTHPSRFPCARPRRARIGRGRFLPRADAREDVRQQGYYRCGGKNGRRMKAENVERQVLDQIGQDLSTDAIIDQCTRLARKAARPGSRDVELKTLQRQAQDLERKIGRVRLVMTEMENPRAMAPQLEQLVAAKEEIDRQVATLVDDLSGNQVMRMISEDDTRALLGNLGEALRSMDRMHVKTRLRALLEKIVVDPAQLSARIYYAIPAATGDSLASPRGFEPRLPP